MAYQSQTRPNRANMTQNHPIWLDDSLQCAPGQLELEVYPSPQKGPLITLPGVDCTLLLSPTRYITPMGCSENNADIDDLVTAALKQEKVSIASDLVTVEFEGEKIEDSGLLVTEFTTGSKNPLLLKCPDECEGIVLWECKTWGERTSSKSDRLCFTSALTSHFSQSECCLITHKR